MKRLTGLFAAGLLLSAHATAQTFVTVPPPDGETNIAVIGINDKGDVAGSYVNSDGEQIGFSGAIDGTYETFSAENAPTQARSLNNQGLVTGFYSPSGTINEFVRAKDGTITTITKDGEPVIGIAQGVNASGTFVGDYFNGGATQPIRGGFEGKNGAYVADVTLPFPTVRVAPRAINAKGDIAGWFIAEAGTAPQGFVIQSGVTTVLTYPDANMATFVQGLNNKGELSGSWTDTDGNMHGFALASDLESWTSFDAPEGTQTQAWQINSLGQIAVTSSDDTTSYGYVYCPGKGGVCTGKNEKSATTSSAKGKSGMRTPAAVGAGTDPDAAPGQRKGQRN